MDFPEVRKFLIASYHDLPNILFVGCILLGSLLGYLPLIWLALGLIINGFATTVVQMIFRLFFKAFPSLGTSWKSQFMLPNDEESQRCFVGFQVKFDKNTGKQQSITSTGTTILGAPSYWMSSAAFFAMFSIYNSIRVVARESNANVDPMLVSTRKAFSISTLIIGIVFMTLIFARAFTGCETKVSGTLGVLLGIGMAIGVWHMLDACGTGKLPDILQVVGSMAPDHAKNQQPVMCVAPKA